MGASVWHGFCECVNQKPDRGRPVGQIFPDTGSTSYAQPTLPCLDLTDEGWDELDAWITMQAGNGEPGEGSEEWEAFIRYLADKYPEAVVSETEQE